LEAGYSGRFKWVEYLVIADLGRGRHLAALVGAWRLLRQLHCHDDSNDARRDVANARRQRELPGQASIRPKDEENAASDAVDLGATIQCSGIAETRLAMLPDNHRPTAAVISGISKPNNTVGTAFSPVAKYALTEPRY
jgi:hypothetical protein